MQDSHDAWINVALGTTASDGTYDLHDLRAGNYRLDYVDVLDGYVEQWYSHRNSRSEADDVSAHAGETTSGIDVVLEHEETTPPTTTLSGADDLWHNQTVHLTLSAVDSPGGSGMSGGSATTQYRVDDRSWSVGTSFWVYATPDHTNDGLHTVSYKSCDANGNWETAKSALVKESIPRVRSRGARRPPAGRAAPARSSTA